MATIIVDTNVLIDVCEGDRDWSLDCMGIFLKIHEGVVQLGVDNEGKILDEYQKTLNKHLASSNAQMIVRFIKKERYRTNGIRKIKSYFPINETAVRELLSMGFHDKDLIFVRIASVTDLKIIFSSDSRSFLKSEYSLWLQEKLGVETKHPSDYLSFISDISRSRA